MCEIAQDIAKQRLELAAAARRLYMQGLTCATGGNISVRTDTILLISRTDTAFGRLTPGDCIACTLTGEPLETGKPSKEVGFHAAIYQARPDVQAIVHLHAPYSIMLGAFPLDKTNVLPPCSYAVITKVGRAPSVEYYRPGHSDLFRCVGEKAAIAGHAVYMEKHGITTFGPSLNFACDVAEEFEQNAKVYVLTGGKVPLLSQQEVFELLGAKL